MLWVVWLCFDSKRNDLCVLISGSGSGACFLAPPNRNGPATLEAWNLGSCWLAKLNWCFDFISSPFSSRWFATPDPVLMERWQVYSAHPQPLPHALPRLDVAWQGMQGCAMLCMPKFKVTRRFVQFCPYGCFSVWIPAGIKDWVSDDNPLILGSSHRSFWSRLPHRD